jgi:threonine synthase
VATAHPAKFPEAVEAATGVHPELPARLADLFAREEHYEVLPADLGIVKDVVSSTLHRQRADA